MISFNEAKERLIAFLELFPYATALVVFAVLGMLGLSFGVAVEDGPQALQASLSSWDIGLEGITYFVAFIAIAGYIVFKLGNHTEKR